MVGGISLSLSVALFFATERTPRNSYSFRCLFSPWRGREGGGKGKVLGRRASRTKEGQSGTTMGRVAGYRFIGVKSSHAERCA